MMSAKLSTEYEDAVDTEPFAPMLFDLLCAESSLLAPLADRPPLAICSGGPLLFP